MLVIGSREVENAVYSSSRSLYACAVAKRVLSSSEVAARQLQLVSSLVSFELQYARLSVVVVVLVVCSEMDVGWPCCS